MSDNSLSIKISSKLAPDFANTFKSASAQVHGLRDEIINLRKQQSLIKKFEMNMDAAKKARVRLFDVRQEIKQLDIKIKQDRKLGLSTKKAQTQIAQLSKRAKRLETTVGNANSRLIASKKALSASGLSARDTASSYEKLNAKIKSLDHSYSSFKANAAQKLQISNYKWRKV